MTNIHTYRKLAQIAAATVPSNVTAKYGDSEDFHELFGESISKYIRKIRLAYTLGMPNPTLMSCKWFASWNDCIQLCASEKDAIATYLQMTGNSHLIPFDYYYN